MTHKNLHSEASDFARNHHPFIIKSTCPTLYSSLYDGYYHGAKSREYIIKRLKTDIIYLKVTLIISLITLFIVIGLIAYTYLS